LAAAVDIPVGPGDVPPASDNNPPEAAAMAAMLADNGLVG
jgi:hypothetical protein